ncbi:MAG: hypothetical protein H7A46_08230 [Verrucomicrobiales bacterium]|nr:hypothetical protein [Verrucomicrobiales bacterium]
MKVAYFCAAILALALTACSGKKEEPAKPAGTNQTDSATNQAYNTGNPLTAPVDYLGAVGQAQRHSEKVLDTVQIQSAIRQFQAVEDRNPKDLNELVSSGYLTQLPKAPYGMKVQYDARSGQVTIVRQQ